MVINKKILQIAVLGPQGSGKTVFISSLFFSFIYFRNDGYSGRFLHPAEEQELKKTLPNFIRYGEKEEYHTKDKINKYWDELFKCQKFPDGTESNWNYLLSVRGEFSGVVAFYDVPGGWFEEFEKEEWGEKKKEDRGISDRIEHSDSAFLIVDTHKLVNREVR